MVFSSSYIYSQEHYSDAGFFFKRQIGFTLVGLLAALIVQRVKFSFLLKYSQFICMALTLCLILTFLPGIGVEVKGSSRWLNFGLTSLQPGEFVKYAVVLFSLTYFENFLKLTTQQKLIGAATLFAPLFCFTLQPDFGSFVICVSIMGFIAFMSSFPRKYLYSLVSIAIVGMAGLILAAPYRVARIMAFLDPWKDPRGTGFQIIQSFLAFANGSFWGNGIGNSNEKLFYLPEAHNDFIFSVIGEELGFIGVLFVVVLFLSFIYFGFKIALQNQGKLRVMAAVAIIFTIGLQATLNMGVVLGLLPTKGLNLPFISYGGSSLISNLIGIGLYLSATKMKEVHSVEVNENETKAFSNRGLDERYSFKL